MKNGFHAAIFVGILSALIAGHSSSALAATDCKTTHAHVKKHLHVMHVVHARTAMNQKGFNLKIRAAQMRLDDLGYFVGYYDGVIGLKTRTAIKAFQRSHDMRANGVLTDKTFETLCMTDYLANHYYLTSVTDPKGRIFQAGAPYNRPGYISAINGAWVVRGGR